MQASPPGRPSDDPREKAADALFDGLDRPTVTALLNILNLNQTSSHLI